MEQVYASAKLKAIKTWLGSGAINIFGYPFAGKDTQGGFLAQTLSTTLIGGGEILRSSVIPPHAKAIIDRGGLAPTETYMQIMIPYLSRPEFAGQPLILSSVGRWSGEETGVMEAAAAAGHPIKAVFSLNLDERDVWRRFEALEKSENHPRGYRHDDAADAIEVRLEEFRVKTLPVIDFYRSQGLVIDIDSTRPIDTVHHEIVDRLYERASEL